MYAKVISMKRVFDMRMKGVVCFAIMLLAVVCQPLSALNRRMVTTQDGLSSMFVMSLYQDSLGYMWVGTYNGISILEGNNSHVATTRERIFSQLKGSVVESIQGGSYGQVWFHSNYSLMHWDARRGELRKFPEINSIYKFVVSSNDEVLVASQERGLLYYNGKEERFLPFSFENLRCSDILTMTIDKDHHWHVVTPTRMYEAQLTAERDGTIGFRLLHQREFEGKRIRAAFADGDRMYLVDEHNEVIRTTLRKGAMERLFPLSPTMLGQSRVTSIVSYGNDILIGFTNHGAVRMTPCKSGSEVVWEESRLDVKSGVFDIKYDARQHILWVATDGEGIRYFSDDPYEIRTESLQKLPFPISTPVRDLQKDCEGTLWMSTKGDGLVAYHDYDPESGRASKIEHFTTENSLLLHNSIYCMSEGHNGIIWMGSDGRGINFYLPRRHYIGVLDVGDFPIHNVHGLTEVDDELWIATWGHGIYCVHLRWNGDMPAVESIDQILYDPEHWELEQALAIQARGNSIWVTYRENGVAQIERRSNKHRTYAFASPRLSVANDVLSLNTKAPQGVLFATSAGLFMKPDDPSKPAVNLNDTLGLESQTVRSVIYTRNGNVWFCTPHGMVQWNTKNMMTKTYAIGNNIEVSEFVEGAAYYDEENDIKYFGGTGGFIVISPQRSEETLILPDIQFHDVIFLTDGMDIRPITDNAPIEIEFDRNDFTIKYDAVDYLHADNYIFEYCLDDGSHSWIQNGRSRSISFINQRPGKYTLSVRYRIGSYISPSYELKIRILPPWWLSWPMKLLYTLLAMAMIAYVVYRYVRRQRRRNFYMIERMNEKHRQDVYESKLRFFTNITHEFSTPLTLISGPCQRILDMSDVSADVKDYATVIQRSSTRLNDLIQQLIEFRRIDTGNRVMNIVETNVSDRLRDTVSSFCVEAEKHHISYKVSIQPDLVWTTDVNAFTTICINLISNAFKYVKENGDIFVDLHTTEQDELQLKVSNSGRAISSEQIKNMFNRYTILEGLEDDTLNRGFARNGLGLAITQGLITGLGGNIDVQGDTDLTTFKVTLPRQKVSVVETTPSSGYTAIHHDEDSWMEYEEKNADEMDENKATVLVVDDDKEMLWFLDDILRKDYNVISFSDPELAMKSFEKNRVDLVISDIVMEPFDGVELCRRIKDNSLTSHIPIILLSSRQNEETQVASANAGAELFLSKPFEINYFLSVVRNQLKRNQKLKDYFDSSLSAFDVVDGRHLHHEDKLFLDRITQIINDNLTNPELTTQFLAQELGVGLRNIYRKLEGITSLTPKDMIREARLERARKLLTKTGMNVEEVCYQAGFNNRGTFYKLFAAKFGCTPKQYHESQLNKAKDELNQS